jgi:hypothetical protein
LVASTWRKPDGVAEGRGRLLAGLVVPAHDRGVVDQDVQTAELALDDAGEPPDAGVVGDVELMAADVQLLRAQLPGRRLALGRITAGQDHPGTEVRQLPAGLETHAAVGAGHHRDLARHPLAHESSLATATPRGRGASGTGNLTKRESRAGVGQPRRTAAARSPRSGRSGGRPREGAAATDL